MVRTLLDIGPAIAVLLIALAALFSLHLTALDLATPAVIVVWLLLAPILAYGLYRQARARRKLLLGAHVRPDSPLQRYLSGRLFLALKALLQAVALAALLLPFVVRLDQTAAWQLLVIHLPFAVLFQLWLRQSLSRHLSVAFLPIALWRLGLGLNLALLVILLAAASLHGHYPAMQDISLLTAVSNEVTLQQAESRVLLAGLQFHAALDAIAWWLAQQLPSVTGLPLLHLVGWLLLFGVKALFLWSYLLYLAGMLTLTAELRAWWRQDDRAH